MTPGTALAAIRMAPAAKTQAVMLLTTFVLLLLMWLVMPAPADRLAATSPVEPATPLEWPQREPEQLGLLTR